MNRTAPVRVCKITRDSRGRYHLTVIGVPGEVVAGTLAAVMAAAYGATS